MSSVRARLDRFLGWRGLVRQQRKNGGTMRLLILTAVCLVFSACTSSNGGAFIGIPTPGAVTLTPGSLAFTATGASSAQTVKVSQANYSGSFAAATTTCSGIATIASASATAFSVTPVAAGSCTFTITGGGGQSAALTIGVTTTSVGGH